MVASAAKGGIMQSSLIHSLSSIHPLEGERQNLQSVGGGTAVRTRVYRDTAVILRRARGRIVRGRLLRVDDGYQIDATGVIGASFGT